MKTDRIIATLWCVLVIAFIAMAAGIPNQVTTLDGTDRNIKSFTVQATASGDNTLVAGATNHLIKVLALSVRAYSDTAVKWYLKTDTDLDLWGSSANPLTSDLNGVDGPAFECIPFNPVGSITTKTAGEALEINLGAATPLWVTGNYVVVPE